jgi:signal transduction histidine kinase
MHRKTLSSVTLVLALSSSWGTRLAAESGATPAEAKALLEKASAYYKSVGRKQAFADFTAKRRMFSDRDLYVFCIDTNRMMVANGGFPGIVGTSADTIIDVNGKGLGKAAWEAVSDKGEGVVRYRWVDPITHNLESKTTFLAKTGDDVCGVGAYDHR